MDTYQLLLRILMEEFGVVIFDSETEDFAITDYITDSISFIQFITLIEDEIGDELPDDFLLYDIVGSAKGFAEKLDAYITMKQNNL